MCQCAGTVAYGLVIIWLSVYSLLSIAFGDVAKHKTVSTDG